MQNASNESFSQDSLLNISEIGIVREDTISCVRTLNDQGFLNWREVREDLTPVGDEQGLFIVVKQDRTWYFSDKMAQEFPVGLKVQGKGILML